MAIDLTQFVSMLREAATIIEELNQDLKEKDEKITQLETETYITKSKLRQIGQSLREI